MLAGAGATRNELLEEEPTIVMGPLPGFLTLSPSRSEALIAREPLHQLYTVENQPFARGKFAAVKRCRNVTTGEEFAAKVIRKRRRGTGLTPESLHEAATLDLCRSCPHIVRLEQVYDTPGETILILQLAEGGELQSVLDRDEIPEEEDVIRLLRQVLSGLAFLHQFDIAHLDLKPQNLLLTGAFPNCDIKLCDFGIARHIARGADVREILGTPDYVAPEVLNYEPISLATDMWSVGVLAYVLLTGCTPFGGETKQETFCNITRCQLEFPEDLFRDVSPLAIQFISGLLVQDSGARLTAAQCLDHPWLRAGSTADKIPSFLSLSEDSSTFSSNSTIVPDDDDSNDVDVDDEDGGDVVVAIDQTDATVAFHETVHAAISRLEESPLSSRRDDEDDSTASSPADITAASAAAAAAGGAVSLETTPVLNKRSEANRVRLSAVIEDPAFAGMPITRRAGSLPYRWRASINHQRAPSCDRTSDLGYGSDGISEVSSADSSSDRSSIISLDDSPLEWAQTAMRRYSDTSLAAERLWRRTWERFLPATAGTCVSLPHRLYQSSSSSASSSGQQSNKNQDASNCSDQNRPWERVCTGSRARAMERFNASPPAQSLSSCSSAAMSKSTQALNSLVVRPAPVKVSEVRTRLLRGPTTATKTVSPPVRTPLLHLDKTEIVKSRLVKFRTGMTTCHTNQQAAGSSS